MNNHHRKHVRSQSAALEQRLIALLGLAKAKIREAGFRFEASEGRFVPPQMQDSIGWSDDLIREAEGTLWTAANLRQPRRLQIEVAIQSAHVQRRVTGQTPWRAIAQQYGVLVQHHANLGARVGLAVAQAEAGEPAAAEAPSMSNLPAGPEVQRSLGRTESEGQVLAAAVNRTPSPTVRNQS